MEQKQSRLVVVLSLLFVLFAVLTAAIGARRHFEESRPMLEATQQANQLATQIANFYLTPTIQPSPTPSLVSTNQAAFHTAKLRIPTPTKTPSPTPNPHAEELEQALALVDFEFNAWQSINPHVQAWIQNDSINVNHPVLASPDNEYYLTRDVDLSAKAMGSIFFDFRNNPDFSGRNTIIYGHNFDNGLMFSNLVWYKDQHFFEEHPFYYLYTPDQVYRVDIAAGIVVSETDITYLDIEFQSDLEFRSLLQKIKTNSVINSEIELTPSDKLVTLYTCTNDWQGQRFVVIGKITPLGPFSEI